MNRYQHAISEPARISHCTRCGTPVIRAYADGLDLSCDTTPLTHTSEALALLDQRITVELLVYASGTVELVTRGVTRIRADRDTTVLATHRCTGPALTTAQVRALPPSAPFVLTPPTFLDVAGATPPF